MSSEDDTPENALIAVGEGLIGGEMVQTVDARDLHEFLQVGKKFADWMRERIEQYEFSEGVDYATFSQNGEKGRPTKEYAVTLDMAKELSMVERTPQGKAARRYFIECERRAKIAQENIPDFEQLVAQSEQTRALISSNSQKVAEIGRVIGGVTRNVVREVDAKHAHTIRALGKLVNEYIVKQVIHPLRKVDSRVNAVERRLDGVIDMAKRAASPVTIVWTEWLDVSGIYTKAGVCPPQRGILSQQVQRSIDAWCKSHCQQHAMNRITFGGKPTNVWHIVAVGEWLRDGGQALINSHIARFS